ncbi:cellulose synthase operon protein YhjQ/BcsQ [Pirellulaceae bacterium SH501]
MKPIDAPNLPSATTENSLWEVKIPGRSEQAASLARKILSLRPNQQDSKAIGLTSLGDKAGHQRLAIQCAVALAEQVAGKVLLVQLSAPNSASSKLLVCTQGSAPESGWDELVLGQAETTDSIAPTHISNLFLLPPKVTKQNREKSGLPTTSQIQSTLTLLKEQFDVVLVDLPCIKSSKGIAGVAASLDGVVLVADHRRDPSQKLQQATEQYRNQNVHWIGVVLANFRSYVPRFLRRHK